MSGINRTEEFANHCYLKIGEKLHSSYSNDRMADFHFVFESADGRCERVPAHKIVLSAVSDVFEKMFNGL